MKLIQGIKSGEVLGSQSRKLGAGFVTSIISSMLVKLVVKSGVPLSDFIHSKLTLRLLIIKPKNLKSSRARCFPKKHNPSYSFYYCVLYGNLLVFGF
jgi:hypothetical protein